MRRAHSGAEPAEVTARADARPGNLEAALEALAADELVALPTETVWGLAARACRGPAVERIHAFKGRASDQPISVFVDAAASLASLGVRETPMLLALVDAFWPGPLTVVASCADPGRFAPGIAGTGGAVGFRCSDHPVTSVLVREASKRGLGPLTATSFNRSGETPVERYSEAVLLAKTSRAPAVLVIDPGARDAFALPPSTVIDLSEPRPRILREGAVSRSTLDAVLRRFREA